MRPGLDDKVLADWNGMMIAALVNAGVHFDEPSWLQMAARAFLFIDGKMTKGDRLGHSWRADRLLFPGLASDHANMIRAALALHEATGERAYLERALAWQAALDRHYANAQTGGYFLTADDAEGLVVRPNATSDDATPNPNAVAAQNLVRLAGFTGQHAWRDQVDRLFDGLLPLAADNLFMHVALLNALGPAAARDRDRRRRHRRARRRAHRGGAEAAVPRPHRDARAVEGRAAADASRGGEARRDRRAGGVHLRRRNLLAAGDGAGADRRDDGVNARPVAWLAGEKVMPLYFKIPAYLGNSLLLLVGVVLIFQGTFGIGVGIAALACLNLYLVRKLDVFSREEVWLAAELVKERLRDELQKARNKFARKP